MGLKLEKKLFEIKYDLEATPATNEKKINYLDLRKQQVKHANIM